ncbi:putative bifunctional diguanylate cyclase/phosphodiesterase [Hydrogenophilus thermoluteolus]|uniref:putative bifunctional diguanylate cyclase/phosphodiesterase n=1 Tax=Hydrogenophilus thermoluteolus TaxID=297 RepID=UPI003F680897
MIRSLLAILVIVVGSSRALSDTLRELEYFSMHDPLTHLYNRRHFLHMLEYEIGRSERHQHAFSLIMIDLDDFKEINDTYGHPAGDLALTELANVLQAQVRQGDLACRIGGDEFILLLPETPLEGAKALARKLCDRLRAHRYFYQGTSFHVTCSLGIVSYPQDGKSVHELLAHADLAAYEAKRRGKDEICAYDDLKTRRTGGALTRDSLAEQRSEVEALREALAERRIVPFFQPIVDMASGQVVAFEVLARLIPSVGDPIPAGRFITVIEKYGLGRELDRQIIAAALAALRDFLGEKPTLFLNHSLHYLRELELDFVKIDGAFVRGMQTSRVDKALVRNLANLCADLGMQTVAEFVENEETLTLLQEMGITHAQGYYLGLPLPRLPVVESPPRTGSP